MKPRGLQASAEHFVRLPELCYPDSHVKEQIEGFGDCSSVSKKIVCSRIVNFFLIKHDIRQERRAQNH
jgi:hypothetical protein